MNKEKMIEKIKEIMPRLDKLIEFSLLALIFTLPFSKSMVEIFFTISLICWILKRAMYHYSATPRVPPLKAFVPVSTELNFPIAVFTSLGFLSMLTSISFTLSLEGFFFKLFEWIMIYFIVAEVINNKERIERVLTAMLISAVLMSIDGVFQAIKGTDFLLNYSAIKGYIIRASFDSPNGFGAWLIVMLFLVFSLAYFSKNSKRLMFWILVCPLIFCLVSTYSKGVWIASLLSFIFLSLLRGKKSFAITVIVILILPFITPNFIKQRAEFGIKISGTNVTRVTLWQEALNITADFPLLGSGLNTYAIIAPRYKLTEETGMYPHNCYLQMAAESGVLGLGAFLWILVILFKTSLINVKRINDKFYKAILVGLLAGLFGLLLHSFVDTDIYSLQLGNLMWFIMGLIIAVQKVSFQENL